MSVIDRPKLIEDIIYWLPSSNVLDKTSLTKLASLVIARVGDDSAYEAQILCESLEACALKNLSESRANGSQVKKEVLGGHTKEYFEGGSESLWQDYIDSLDSLCPLFGYNRPMRVGISIAPGKIMSLCYEDLETIY